MPIIQNINKKSKAIADNLSCPVCQDGFVPGQEVVNCPKCKALYHRKCWSFNNNACAVHQCPGAGQVKTSTVLAPLTRLFFGSIVLAVIIVLALFWNNDSNISDEIKPPPIAVITSEPASTPTVTTGLSAPSRTLSSTPPTGNSQGETITGIKSAQGESDPSTTPTSSKKSISGRIKTGLNVREGPGVEYKVITQLNAGDEVPILRRNQTEDWLEIETPNKQIGWAARRFIDISGDLADVEIAPVIPPPPTPTVSEASESPTRLNLRGASISGTLSPHDEKWYIFSEENRNPLIILMFDPNVNLNTDEMTFFIYDQNQIQDWPPPIDPDLVPHLGLGSHPASDRDGDGGTGELIWRGAPLFSDTRYYLRLVNSSSSTVKYCLMFSDILEWSCNR